MIRFIGCLAIVCFLPVQVWSEPGVPRPSLRQALDVEWLKPEERSSLHRAHGLWDDQDLRHDDDRILAALLIGDVRDDGLLTTEVSPYHAARWLQARGEFELALQRLQDQDLDARGHLLKGDLLRALGRREEAGTSYAAAEPDGSSANQTAVVTASRRLAEMNAARSGAYQRLMDQYAAVRSADPLDWQARMQEADLLLEKNDPADAYKAVREVLELNPRLGEAWLYLGRLALMRFDFDGADDAVSALRDLVPDHPMADLLEGESLLMQDEIRQALSLARGLREELPWWPEAMCLELSIMAVMEDPELDEAMTRFESRFPGSPLAAYRVGDALSFQRQYPESDTWLRRAIDIRPEWPAPWIELGLMQWQDARMEDATATLRKAVELDDFNHRAFNSLKLLEELADYEVIETPEFILRYKSGVDELLVREMVPRLESIHDDTVTAFGWKPERRTIIELFPDHEQFAVRIVGMPDLHTVAACTGPCVAMEVPRLGVAGTNLGPYDWERVLRHEFAHTVNLDQTDYRVPLWFTEAAAVWMEPGPRKWQTCLMLAQELKAGTLLSMEEISWAFVRPRRPQDRSLAYAQSNWMLEFIIEKWGIDSLARIMDAFRSGRNATEAFEFVLGVDEDTLFDEFKVWARSQVRSWGLMPEPSLAELLSDQTAAGQQQLLADRQSAEIEYRLRQMRDSIGQPEGGSRSGLPELRLPESIEDDDLLDRLRVSHPDHPDVVQALINRLLQGGVFPDEDLIERAKEYVELRPIDPLGHQVLADWWLEQDQPELAVGPLAVLASQEEYDPQVPSRL
ncbi:MAG: tetratricopeptide repeat protein, partial [Phycisphaerales bacterium]|nr:tetratricopeptide repeat protein [Phycisphaerales bacterium]